MPRKVLIIFVKNILLGKVKTRLAKSIGDIGAFEVYKYLVEITERESSGLKGCDLRIYFSDVVIDSKWPVHEKYVQEGTDLGERMLNAFSKAFEDGYEQVVGIGSDLPDLNTAIINDGFQTLESADTVFGPAADGGYYLIGMNTLHDFIFKNKAWSTDQLLHETLKELREGGLTYQLLIQLNDIDTLEDLKNSSISDKFEHLYELSRGNE